MSVAPSAKVRPAADSVKSIQDAPIESVDEVDLTSVEGLRKFQRSFIRQEPNALLLGGLFPALLSSALRADKSLEWQLAALDALSIWLLRATRSADSLQISSSIQESDCESLISLTWTRWSSAPNSNAIQKILKEIFAKILLFQQKVFPDWRERDISLLERVVFMTGVDIKVQCFMIEVLVRRASDGAKRVLQSNENWVRDMLLRMKDGGVGPAVGKCIVSVLTARRSELMESNPENGHKLWLETWKDPLLKMVSGSDEVLIRMLNKYFLPTLSKECPSAFTDLLENMAREFSSQRELTALQAFVLCLSIARKNGLLHEDPTIALVNLGLPIDFFHSLLLHASSAIRLTAFDLLTFHNHQKTPISRPCFALIQSVLRQFFAEQDAELRIEILRSMRSLILRLRASTHAALKELERQTSKLGNAAAELSEIIETSKKFVEWLVAFCRFCVTPGRSYYTTSMGLKILQIMAEEGFFTDLEIEVKSGVLSGVHVELFAKGTLVVFLNRLADPYDEVARLVYWFIERIKEPATITWEMLYKMGRELCLSRRADKAKGGAKVLSLCYKFSAINGRYSIWEEIWNSIVEDVKTEDLKRITIEKPLHGRLILLSSISIPNTSVGVNRISKLCADIWTLVSPILTHDSPEGNLHNLLDDIPQSDSALRDSTAQEILSNSWRSLKEASSLLGTVLSLPSSTREEYDAAGYLFMEWLSRIRHRGAFSAVMPAFEFLCNECFKHTTKNLNTLPRQWLENRILSVTSTSRSITRRSGGLPMLITAILVAEAESQKHDLTHFAITRLLEVAASPVDSSGLVGLEPAKWDLPQVHAENALRSLFIESKLSQAIFGYLEDAFVIAVNGFSSDIFPLRNSSIMLFDSLMSRALGQKFARQDIDPSAPNKSVSSKVFFSKFPRLRTYLLKQLQNDVFLLRKDEDIVNTGLYPILTLLSRLDVTRGSDTRKYTGMHAFKPLIKECMCARFWKVRSMAARCLPIVTDQQSISQEISELFQSFRLDAQNKLHGTLMGIKQLAEFYSYRGLRDVVFETVVTGMEESFELILRRNTNPSTKAAFVGIAEVIFGKEIKADTLMKKVQQACLEDLRGEKHSSVGSKLYHEQAATLQLEMCSDWKYGPDESPEWILYDLLRNKNEEVVSQALTFFNESQPKGMQSIKGALESLLLSNPSKRVRALTVQSLSSIEPSEEPGIPLKHCLKELELATVLPLREAWITHSGYAALEYFLTQSCDEETLLKYYEVLSSFSQSQQPESTRLAALNSLSKFSPILRLAFQNPLKPLPVLPAILNLFTLLSDDDYEIRNRASQLTANILGQAMTSTPMGSEEILSKAIVRVYDNDTIEQKIIPILCQTNILHKLKSPLDRTDDLFAKERDNVWRDEIYQHEYYLRILDQCWSRKTGGEKVGDSKLVQFGKEAVHQIQHLSEKYKEDTTGFGWNNDVCEAIMKISLIVDLLDRHGRITITDGDQFRLSLPTVQETLQHQPAINMKVRYSQCFEDTCFCSDEESVEETVETAALFPVDSNHPSVKPFEATLRHMILTYLNSQMISEYHLTLIDSSVGPLILLGASLGEHHKTYLQDLVKLHRLSIRFEEPLRLFESKSTSIIKSPIIGKRQQCIQPGCSIGPAKTMLSGSAGVILTDGNSHYLLTCAHFLFSPAETFNKKRGGLMMRNELYVDVVHPSLADVEIEKLFDTDRMERIQRASDSVMTPKERSQIVHEIKSEIEANLPKSIGRTIYRTVSFCDSPEYEEAEYCGKLDYALVALDKKACCSNALPKEFHHPTGRLGELKDKLVVTKVGRTTGDTTGIVNGVQTSVNVDGKTTSEWTVVGENGEVFAEHGDSGSGVWSLNGDCVGLLWGSATSSGMGFITPIQQIFDDLRLDEKYRELRVKSCGVRDMSTLLRAERRRPFTLSALRGTLDAVDNFSDARNNNSATFDNLNQDYPGKGLAAISQGNAEAIVLLSPPRVPL